jgi:hypothetical protein
MANLKTTLDKTLTLEQTDNPVPPKPQGENTTTTKGTHNPNKPTKFIQMPWDHNFTNINKHNNFTDPTP